MPNLMKSRMEIPQSEAPTRKVQVPLPFAKPDFTKLINAIVTGVLVMDKEQFEDEDFKHFVFEAAMEAVYGKDYWIWRNSRTW